eukprot:CAMPEP_0172783242 /NCGR_PEP_ID=MMETSP1074-20121228/204336_1 /TAXON_ID=2916 /ORGANISM="Ceratium fusus, Strain PA161109" /LENGTH=111 /DNA_ID=CAMNT_0013620229 /DNA_START=58 /DNA_END=394 /DNA_ORIENTATION=-
MTNNDRAHCPSGFVQDGHGLFTLEDRYCDDAVVHERAESHTDKPSELNEAEGIPAQANSTIQIKIVEDILIVDLATADERCVTLAPEKQKNATLITERNSKMTKTFEFCIW